MAELPSFSGSRHALLLSEPQVEVLLRSDPAHVSCSPDSRCVALQLPRELSRRVFAQLDCEDLVSCALVCKQWYFECAELIQGWKEEYREACILRGLALRGLSGVPGSCTPRAQFEAFLAGSPD